ncbi:MAG: hypothetical protein JW802_10930 [Campylobacterales bacterium]|nr:hypothetical protein [Campylobacterales bacterium]MBN2833010.1 hypothetical protein [Campylobacterales bacterium]
MYKTVKPTTFTLPHLILEDLETMSQELGKKKNAISLEALEMYMDYQDLQLAKKRIQESEGRLGADEFFKEIDV